MSDVIEQVAVAAPDPQPAVARPFVKWAGGKRKLTAFLATHLPPRIVGDYVEPFVGGGALFFHLVEAGRLAFPHRCVLGDSNLMLVDTYTALAHEVDAVLAYLTAHADAYREGGGDYYYAMRKSAPQSIVDGRARVAAWVLFMNRVCFNGIWRVNRRGDFNVPHGRYTNPTIVDEANLRAVSFALRGVRLYHGDFQGSCAFASPDDVFYFDPPYLPVSKTSDFTAYAKEGFGMDDQKRLAATAARLVQRGAHVVLSNSDAPGLRELYPPDLFDVHEVEMARGINSKVSKRGKVKELVFVGRRP